MAYLRARHGELEIAAVFFDVGETLVDRTREWAAFARLMGLPAHTFSAVFGAVVAAGGGVGDVIERLRPGARLADVRHEVAAAGLLPVIGEQDLYPGARPALARLREAGLFVGVAGNQPVEIGAELRALGLPADLVAVSAELGAAKPEPAFFAALADAAGAPPEQVLYVGDQLDNDVVAPRAAGLPVVRVRTGPWGVLCADPDIEAGCAAVLDSVADLPQLITAPAGVPIPLHSSQ